ncbi:hypothetical protein [Streptomyces sp. fd1-xmd]|uniref:hypothetical protein n=1 Tax=Streptomyces sp. fd1-xmd TaxID=1812480 RepID=UPI0009904216|nr:hypothetical protein [Streptomyces sp. fd1-xmd]AQT70356.1 hypothetical protein B1K54_00005 [Streptomyces sp. fd1-xmd]
MTNELTVLKRDRAVSRDDAIRMLLQQSRRPGRAVPIRRAFVQSAGSGPRIVTEPGPLHQLVRSGERLELLLLVHCVTSGGDWGVTARAETWARAAGISFRTDGTASAAVSRHLAKLRELDLVDTAPDGRMTRIFKLFEDGSGDPYTAPPGKAEGSRRDVYFKVPFDYWEQGFHESLSVPAKVMLLIYMSMRSRSFELRQDKKFASWYGISPSTAGRGIRELQEKELVYPFLSEQHLDGLAVLGHSTRERWALAAPFDLNINKTDREAAEGLWTVEGVARTAARFAAVVPASPAATQAAPDAADAADAAP